MCPNPRPILKKHMHLTQTGSHPHTEMGREKLQNFQKENSMPSLEFRVKFDI